MRIKAITLSILVGLSLSACKGRSASEDLTDAAKDIRTALTPVTTRIGNAIDSGKQSASAWVKAQIYKQLFEPEGFFYLYLSKVLPGHDLALGQQKLKQYVDSSLATDTSSAVSTFKTLNTCVIQGIKAFTPEKLAEATASLSHAEITVDSLSANMQYLGPFEAKSEQDIFGANLMNKVSTELGCQKA